MPELTLKALHGCLRLLENPAELKRKMPANPSLRPMKEGLFDISRLLGVDNAEFKEPQHIAALVGSQRVVMLRGEPSCNDHVARVFDGARVLLTVLIEPGHFANSPSAQSGPTPGGGQQQGKTGVTPGWTESKSEPPGPGRPASSESNSAPDSLKPLLAGNTTLTCKLFRALFEHILGFAPQGHALQVGELMGNREHSRAFLSTALFILGEELDHENLPSFMLEQGLFGMNLFEYLLQNRDYCGAFYAFRRLDRAFVSSPAEEESGFRDRMDRFNAQFGGKPCEAPFFEPGEQDKAHFDAHLAAADVLDAMALTPWRMGLNRAMAADSRNSLRSAKIIAHHFERFARSQESKEQANQELTDHLLAFARQFSADAQRDSGSAPGRGTATPLDVLAATAEDVSEVPRDSEVEATASR